MSQQRSFALPNVGPLALLSCLICSHTDDATAPSDWIKGTGMVWSALLWPAEELQEEAAWTQ